MKPHSWDGHLVLVHGNEQPRRAGVASWVRRGLELGAKILYIEPLDELPERSLMGVLRASEVCVDAAVDRGQLEVFPADDEAYSQQFQTRAIDDALAAGYPTVRWSAEAETAWSVMSRSAHADVEWSTDELCRQRPVSILCQYPAGLTQPTLQTVCAMHAGGVRDSLLQTSLIPGGIALAGEVDVSNEAILRSSLMAAGSATKVGRGSFAVDLSRLDFLDVAGAKALLTATTAHRMNGGRVFLRAAQPPVERVLRLLDVGRHGCIFEGDL
jgi:anti-anti-sigma factor